MPLRGGASFAKCEKGILVMHYKIGAVYWDSDLDVAFTVTDVRYHEDMQIWAVCRADLDYPCYGQTQHIFTMYPGKWNVYACICSAGVI